MCMYINILKILKIKRKKCFEICESRIKDKYLKDFLLLKKYTHNFFL